MRTPVDGVGADGEILASPERLLVAYASGIFPWPHRDVPLLWFSPDPRFVLEPQSAHVPASLRKRMRRGGYEIRTDTAFDIVKVGFEQFVATAARQNGLVYGMFTAFMALMTGWMASIVFRKD